MADWIEVDRWDSVALASAWRAAQPFPHLVIDGLLSDGKCAELRRAMAKTTHDPARGEIYEMMISREPLVDPALRGFGSELGGEAMRALLSSVSGKTLSRIELRSYVYLPGQYLLPHADFRAGEGRQIAYAFYLSPPNYCEGGELDLYRCAVESGAVSSAERAATIEHRENRLVIFDVGIETVHEVREVLRGARLSLAGWFF
jgi:hypothetical protein